MNTSNTPWPQSGAALPNTNLCSIYCRARQGCSDSFPILAPDLYDAFASFRPHPRQSIYRSVSSPSSWPIRLPRGNVNLLFTSYNNGSDSQDTIALHLSQRDFYNRVHHSRDETEEFCLVLSPLLLAFWIVGCSRQVFDKDENGNKRITCSSDEAVGNRWNVWIRLADLLSDCGLSLVAVACDCSRRLSGCHLAAEWALLPVVSGSSWLLSERIRWRELPVFRAALFNNWQIEYFLFRL